MVSIIKRAIFDAETGYHELGIPDAREFLLSDDCKLFCEASGGDFDYNLILAKFAKNDRLMGMFDD